MTQEEAKIQAWQTYQEAKAKIDNELKEASAPAEKARDEDMNWAAGIETSAWNEYDKIVAELEEHYAPAYEKALRIYHEALAKTANTEEVKADE